MSTGLCLFFLVKFFSVLAVFYFVFCVFYSIFCVFFHFFGFVFLCVFCLFSVGLPMFFCWEISWLYSEALQYETVNHASSLDHCLWNYTVDLFHLKGYPFCICPVSLHNAHSRRRVRSVKCSVHSRKTQCLNWFKCLLAT